MALMTPTNDEQARKLLTAGAIGLLVGIFLCAMNQAGLGSWISVVAAVLAAIGLHRFGRLGPDQSRLP